MMQILWKEVQMVEFKVTSPKYRKFALFLLLKYFYARKVHENYFDKIFLWI